jgi:hypothetical protein
METWKPVLGYEGLYEVSSTGRVRSLDHLVKNRYGLALRGGRVLRQTPDRAGYLQVNLSKENVVTTAKVHRLVAKAFIGDPPTVDSHVNHKDFRKANNAVANLEWFTRQQNHRHAVAAGRLDGAVSPRRAKKLSVEKVRAIKAAIAAGGTWRATAKRFGISAPTLSKIMNGSIWSRCRFMPPPADPLAR